MYRHRRHGAVMAISLGSNHADRYANVVEALAWLRNTFHDVRCSSIYLTPPVSGIGEDYCNAVAICEADEQEEAEEVNERLKMYEASHGRTPHAVTIDLDLVIYNGEILRPKDFQREYFRRGFSELEPI